MTNNIRFVFTDVGQLSNLQGSWSAEGTGVGLPQADVLLVNQPFVTMETESRDTDGEENIVYLWNEQTSFSWFWNKTFGLGFAIWDLDQEMIPLFICVGIFILSFILAHFWPSVTFSRLHSTNFGPCVRWDLSSGWLAVFCFIAWSLQWLNQVRQFLHTFTHTY